MDQIMETAEKHGLYVIEDVAQALGAEYEKIKAGTFGDLAIFSFGIGKSMTSGEGGVVAVKNKELIERIASAQTLLSKASFAWKFRVSKKILAMKVFSNTFLFSFIRNYLEESLNENEQDVLENCISLNNHRSEPALNSTITLAKMPSLSAKIAREQLKKLETFNEKRMMFAANLTEHLNGLHDCVELPETSSNIKNTFTRYPVKLLKGSREGLMKRLARQGVDTGRAYHYLADFFESQHLNIPNTLMLTKRTITIPNHMLLRASDVIRIADILKKELNANVSTSLTV
jgi:dTDP-4-amino-4,6-dideoxygalactose transaminase